MAKTFWTKTPDGNVAHVYYCMDSLQAIHAVIDAAAKHLESASDWVIEGKTNCYSDWVMLIKAPSKTIALRQCAKLIKNGGEYRLINPSGEIVEV